MVLFSFCKSTRLKLALHSTSVFRGMHACVVSSVERAKRNKCRGTSGQFAINKKL